MKPHLLKVPLSEGYSFSIRHDVVPYFYNHWHYHPELELIHILKGSGTQFLGDSIRRFRPGDMVLVGSNLPHLWRNDETYFRKRSRLRAEAIVIHFTPDFMGSHFLGLFENRALIHLMEKARQGIHITGKTRTSVHDRMQTLFGLKGMGRIICLLNILNEVAGSSHTSLISSSGFHRNNIESETNKIDRIYQYVMEHFHEKISLDEIAGRINITPKAFCRYFKSRTRKTFSRFLLEVRIGHACRLLNEENRSVAEVCYESGFNNISNFNRYFKLITKTTPLHYRKQQQKS